VLKFFSTLKVASFISDKKFFEETTLSAKAATPSVEGDFKKQAKIVKYSEVFC
jgi:hypothetical protein